MRADAYYAYTTSTPTGTVTDFRNNDDKERNAFKIPEGVPNNETTQKAMYWRNNGRVGLSSLTLWLHLLDVRHPESGRVDGNAAPYDWDDFRRCYLLLEAVPEWKDKLVIMKSVSPIWSNLIDNWQDLTSLYKQEKFKEISDLINKCREKL